jgi:hypothetical protein
VRGFRIRLAYGRGCRVNESELKEVGNVCALTGQHTSAYVSICVSICVSIRQQTSSSRKLEMSRLLLSKCAGERGVAEVDAFEHDKISSAVCVRVCVCARAGGRVRACVWVDLIVYQKNMTEK